MAPWAPLFVKCHTGSPDTGTGEDGFSFRAVSLLTPLILGVLMMNFLLFYFIYFHSNALLPLPCNSVEGTQQMALAVEAWGLMRIQSRPTLQSHDHTCKEKPWFPLGDTDAMILVFPVEEEEGRANRPFIRKTTLTAIYSSKGHV